MRKACFFLSAIVHALCMILLARMSFPIKIALTSPPVINISLQQPETTLPEALLLPDFTGKGKHGHAQSSLSGSAANDAGSPSSRSSPADRRPGGSAKSNFYDFLSGMRLKLKSRPSSAFNLTLPVPGPFAASELSTTPRTGKWFQPGVYAPGSDSDGIQSDDAGPPGGKRLVRTPFNIQDKETNLWMQNILTRIERNWIIPAVTRLGFSGQVEIALTIDPSGKPLSLAVTKSSSQEALDQAALNAMKACLPFPPLPENVRAGTFVFHFIFTYNA